MREWSTVIARRFFVEKKSCKGLERKRPPDTAASEGLSIQYLESEHTGAVFLFFDGYFHSIAGKNFLNEFGPLNEAYCA